MLRRTFVDAPLRPGRLSLSAEQAHHVRDVLRLTVGDVIELFDAAGSVATGTIAVLSRDAVTVDVGPLRAPGSAAPRAIQIASAVPKADRADWLVEKLSEIGVARWRPLRTVRSVVHPEGVAKYERWRRLAVEAAKQSRRVGVMTIEELAALDQALAATADTCRIVLSTRSDARPLAARLNEDAPGTDVTLYVGPEGGWTDAELDALVAAGVIEASLGATILRIETAAIVGAGIAAAVGR